MDKLELKILDKRQDLRDELSFAVRQNPTSLSIVSNLKFEIEFCDFVLEQLYLSRVSAKVG